MHYLDEFLLERFYPLDLYNWESKSYQAKGEELIKAVEALKLDKSKIP
jgi:hypothetical protein